MKKNKSKDNKKIFEEKQEKNQETTNEQAEAKQKDNTRNDLVKSILLIFLFTAAMARLYYYDRQSGILQNAGQRLLNLL